MGVIHVHLKHIGSKGDTPDADDVHFHVKSRLFFLRLVQFLDNMILVFSTNFAGVPL